jgi:hypothetical protein
LHLFQEVLELEESGVMVVLLQPVSLWTIWEVLLDVSLFQEVQEAEALFCRITSVLWSTVIALLSLLFPEGFLDFEASADLFTAQSMALSTLISSCLSLSLGFLGGLAKMLSFSACASQ